MRRKSGESRLKIALELRKLVLKMAKAETLSQDPEISSKKLKRKIQERIYGFSFPFKIGHKKT